MKALSREQLDSLLAVARKYSERDYLMLLVMFLHGLRVTEVVGGWMYKPDGTKEWNPGLRAENVVDGYIVVPRLKGSNACHQELMNTEREALKKLEPGPDGRLFPMCRKTAWLKFKTYGAEAGIPAFLAHPHTMKHTCGTLGLKGGMTLPQVQTRLGHKSGASTMVYLQVGEDEAAKAFAAAVGA